MTVFLSFNVFSQNSISGIVTDSVKNGVSFVNIAVLNEADSCSVKGAINDELGAYNLGSIAAGNYVLKFFAVGYAELYSQVFVLDSTSQVSMSEITLLQQGVNLNDVSITSIKKTIEFKNGMTILNIEDNIMASGNMVLDVLKRIPGVTVENKNNISISGKQSVRIMIDGRMQQLGMKQVVAMLSSMPADLVSTIEVMKSPPAKYDFDGDSGFFNTVGGRVDFAIK